MKSKSGQVTIFIIIALVLIFAVGGYFLFKGNSNQAPMPSYAEEVFNL